MLGALIVLCVALPPPSRSAPVRAATACARPVPGAIAATPAAHDGQDYTYYLVGLEVTGAKRLTRGQVLALSGLRTGRSVTLSDIVAARTRLADSGLFAKVGYRTRSSGSGYSVIVTFVVDELPWDTRVLFDNFVGITDAQLTAAVAAALPTFDGLAPGSTAALEWIRAALEKAAARAGQPGNVTYILVNDQLLGLRHYRFRLERAAGPLQVCSVAVHGVLGDELASGTRPLVGGEFSRDYVMRYAMQNLLPIETSRGYLRAQLAAIDATRSAAAPGGCDGVDVTIAVQDGPQYRWHGATWIGVTVFTAADLDRRVGLRPDEPADGPKIANAATIVREAYRTKGHLNAEVRADPSFDDVLRHVRYTFHVTEGPQFRMGTLRVDGPPADQIERVKSLWDLAEGDVFDASCAARFAARAHNALPATPGRDPDIEIRAKPDPARLAVDVVVTFKPS